jgi:hypothetical protein
LKYGANSALLNYESLMTRCWLSLTASKAENHRLVFLPRGSKLVVLGPVLDFIFEEAVQ